ncbi:hypothetical protein JOC34_000244 [Virgibacillus halotolerans]|uniref:DUF4352 domain-containing protein n=1 Tax=Virgibacillus halotolerans TaxID=1071053 RepID=UPI001961CA68|nr:DUF4352 domain-containing protein [Virgibacillus halotolerans]MBM7597887.1 hypothetical protein [Virgibacillus halotolerans]
MKKLLMILLAGIFIAGCSNDDTSNEADTDDDQVTEDNDSEDENIDNDDGEEKKDVYQIGETAQITSSSYGFSYEVTVNDFELTTDEIDGYSMEDFNSQPHEDRRFAVINVTLKNTGEDRLVPNDKLSAQLLGELTSESSLIEFYKKGDEELDPGEEMTDDLVYMSRTFFDEDTIYLTYEAEATKEEVKFELPIPENNNQH